MLPPAAPEPAHDAERIPAASQSYAVPPVDAAALGVAPRETSAAAPRPKAEPEPAHPSADPHRPIPELPPVTLTLPPESGLELVETRAKAAPQPEEEERPAGPRRVRPPKVQVAEEPLQMVETANKASPPAP